MASPLLVLYLLSYDYVFIQLRLIKLATIDVLQKHQLQLSFDLLSQKQPNLQYIQYHISADVVLVQTFCVLCQYLVNCCKFTSFFHTRIDLLKLRKQTIFCDIKLMKVIICVSSLTFFYTVTQNFPLKGKTTLLYFLSTINKPSVLPTLSAQSQHHNDISPSQTLLVLYRWKRSSSRREIRTRKAATSSADSELSPTSCVMPEETPRRGEKTQCLYKSLRFISKMSL